MPMNAPYQPIKVHEDICVFSLRAAVYSKRGSMRYFPQKTKGKPYKARVCRNEGHYLFHTNPAHFKNNTGERYPRSVIKFKTERGMHSTQKPVALMEYLIKTYTNKDDTVLDFAMGSGTTGVACKNLGRNFIGIELDPNYFKIACDRINDPKTGGAA